MDNESEASLAGPWDVDSPMLVIIQVRRCSWDQYSTFSRTCASSGLRTSVAPPVVCRGYNTISTRDRVCYCGGLVFGIAIAMLIVHQTAVEIK